MIDVDIYSDDICVQARRFWDYEVLHELEDIKESIWNASQIPHHSKFPSQGKGEKGIFQSDGGLDLFAILILSFYPQLVRRGRGQIILSIDSKFLRGMMEELMKTVGAGA